ncbi:unnamed protein product, partial [Prorocentrum cordatum]
AIARHLAAAGAASAAGPRALRREISATKAEILAADAETAQAIQATLKGSTLAAKATKAMYDHGVGFALHGAPVKTAPRKRRTKAAEQIGQVAGVRRRQAIGAATRLVARGDDDAGARAWRHAVADRADGGHAALAGRGPAAATPAALERLGWTAAALNRGVTDNGATIKLEAIGGFTLRGQIRDSHQRWLPRWLWREAATRAPELTTVAVRGPLREVNGAKASTALQAQRSHARANRHAGCGGRSTARRLAWRCLALAADERNAIAGDSVLQAIHDAAAESDSEEPQFSQALVPMQMDGVSKALDTEEVRLRGLGGGSLLCTDGSALHEKAGTSAGGTHGAWGCVPAHLSRDANAGEIVAAARALDAGEIVAAARALEWRPLGPEGTLE